MKLISFRIQNFKPILDTGTLAPSRDRLTVIVGQNESGKSAVLEALLAFYREEINQEHLRPDGSSPRITCEFQLEQDDVETIHEELGPKLKSSTWDRLFKQPVTVFAVPNDGDAGKLKYDLSSEATSVSLAIEETEEEKSEDSWQEATSGGFATAIVKALPNFVLFTEYASSLPSEITLVTLKNESKSEGKAGAKNFLTVAELTLEKLQKSTPQTRKHDLEIANKRITDAFHKFWNQQLGKAGKVSLELEVKDVTKDQDGNSVKDLTFSFWIKDGDGPLYPAQRSSGLRWYLSFFLYFSAAAKLSERNIYMLDEPASNLHMRAQDDALRFLEEVAKSHDVIYTTHSPSMINPDKPYRILAAHRDDLEDARGPTAVVPIHRLSESARDTLTPIYQCMGAAVLKHGIGYERDNVILEELSAFYYIKAAKKLIGDARKLHILACTGAGNVAVYANLFNLWQLDYVAVFDDDHAGRREEKVIRALFESKSVRADKHVMRTKFADVELHFSVIDQEKYLVGLTRSAQGKILGPKGAVAATFYSDVLTEQIVCADLASETILNLKKLLDDMHSCLDTPRA